MAAMNLNGSWRYREFIADDFVGMTSHQVLQDFLLARGEQGHAGSGHLRQSALIARLFREIYSPTHGVEHELAIKWLFQEIDGASLHSSHREGHIAVARDDDHGQSNLAPVQLLLQLKAIQVGHPDIGNQTRRLRNIRRSKHLFGIVEFLYRI